MAKGYVGISGTLMYTALEYIESTGTQYIDTGVTNDDTIHLIARESLTGIDTLSGSERRTGSSNNHRFKFGTNGNGSLYIGYGSSGPWGEQATLDHIYTFDIQKGSQKIYVDGVLTSSSTVTDLTYYNLYSITLFCLRTDSSVNTNQGTTRLYSCQIYKGNTLVRDYIPVLDRNNVPCLYDKITRTFAYNSGSGNFAASAARTPVYNQLGLIKKAYVGVRMSYTPVEYIETSGVQYIDTNCSMNSNSKIEIKVDFTNNNRQECIFCGRDFNSGGTGINNFTVFKFANSLYRMDYNSVGTNFSHSVSASTPYIYVMNKNNLYENDTLIRTEATATFTTTNTLFLMASRNGDGSVSNYALGKLYYCKIWNGDTLVRDFIPVVDQDNVACLYDLIGGEFYYNKGTGAFTAGSATGQPVQLASAARKIKRGYVGVNGVARKIFQSSLTFTTLYIGSISYPRYGGMASTPDYVVHSGGHNSSNAFSNVTEFFDTNGTKTTGSALSTKRIVLAAATFNERAFFCGGSTSSSWSANATVEYFNNSKVRSTGTSLSTSTYGSQAVANGLSYLMVCGGNGSGSLANMVNFFNTSLTRTTNTLTTAVRSHSVGQINGYAIVAGGADNSTAVSNSQSFNANGVKTTLAALPTAKAGAALASTEDYFFMMGGSSVSATGTSNSTVYVYDKNLVLTVAPSLSAATSNVSGSDCNKEYAIVPVTTTTIVIYDSNLTRSSIPALGYSYEWGGYGRNASGIKNGIIYNNQSGSVYMVKGE